MEADVIGEPSRPVGEAGAVVGAGGTVEREGSPRPEPERLRAGRADETGVGRRVRPAPEGEPLDVVAGGLAEPAAVRQGPTAPVENQDGPDSGVTVASIARIGTAQANADNRRARPIDQDGKTRRLSRSASNERPIAPRIGHRPASVSCMDR